MTTVPMPDDPTQSFTATYDAWNRLVKLEDSSAVVAEYEYDGAKRRTIKKTFSSGVLDETRHLYYTEPSKWQVIEERVDSSTDAERQFVWGQRYIDEIILRDRDTTNDGSLDERLYAPQDANWNVTVLIDVLASIQERYAYQAYGEVNVLTPSFGDHSSSTSNWETTYAGYRLDEESQLFNIRNRILHDAVGWLQRDPVGYHDGYSLYEYASGNPTNNVDPSGLKIGTCGACAVCLGIFFIVLLIAAINCAVMCYQNPGTFAAGDSALICWSKCMIISTTLCATIGTVCLLICVFCVATPAP